MRPELAAAFPDQQAADRAVQALIEAGVPRNAIGVRSGDLEDQVGPPVATVTGAHRVALICAIIAGVVAGVVAILMTTGVVPARGFEFLGTSVLGAALRGATAGAATGALFGYILGMGMWDDDGEPEVQIAVGDTLVTVAATVDRAQARSVLEGVGGRVL